MELIQEQAKGLELSSPRLRVTLSIFPLGWNLKQQTTWLSMRHSFFCLEIAKDMGIQMLSIKGDSYLIVNQVRSRFACKCERPR